MTKQSKADDSLVISYMGLRKAVGFIGLALPFGLALGKLLFDGGGLQSSMSAYYHTNVRNLFVGSLCAIGVFLMSYWGYDRIDNIAAKVASAFAVGVAFFPTLPETGIASAEEKVTGTIHFICAAGFFLTLAFFSLFLFRKTAPKPTPQKRKRNVVYLVCGLTMVASIALIGILALLPGDASIKSLKPVFWLESLAVVAFGVSWLTKGEAILED